MRWLLALSLILYGLLNCKTTVCGTIKSEYASSYEAAIISFKNSEHSSINTKNPSLNRIEEREMKDLTISSELPTQSPTFSPTSTPKAATGSRYSTAAKVSVAFGVLAIAFIGIILLIVLCGRHFLRTHRNPFSANSTKVHPTIELRGVDIHLLRPSEPPSKLDYSEILRQKIAMDSNLNHIIEQQKQLERADQDNALQELRRKEIEDMITEKMKEATPPQLRSLAIHGGSSNKYRVSDAELLDVENNTPNSSS